MMVVVQAEVVAGQARVVTAIQVVEIVGERRGQSVTVAVQEVMVMRDVW
jgi:hypothetical protein